MEIVGKDFDFYWKIIKTPFYLMAIWAVVSLITAMVDFQLYLSIFSAYSNYIISLAIFGFVGWSAVKNHKTSIKEGALSGAVIGVLSGIVGGVIGVIMVYTIPEITALSVQRALESGAQVSADMIESWVKIGSFVGIIISPMTSSWD